MFIKNYYKEPLNESQIAEDIKKEGYNPIKIEDHAGRIYQPHTHPETKLLVFLEGDMDVRVGEKQFKCEAGDKLIIRGNVTHSAVVGNEGCTFFWSEKLI